MVVAAEPLLCVRNLNHQIDQAVYRENSVVLYRILRVNYFNEWPKLLYNLDVVCTYPKVAAHNQVFKERLTKTFILQRKSKLR